MVIREEGRERATWRGKVTQRFLRKRDDASADCGEQRLARSHWALPPSCSHALAEILFINDL